MKKLIAFGCWLMVAGRIFADVQSPLVSTLPVSNLLNDTATLNGRVNPMGAYTTAWFEWGATIASGNLTAPGSVGSGTNVVAVNATVTGLTPGVTYHYRCVASNSLGVARGADQVFWLPALTLNGPNPLINGYQIPFIDPGATVSGTPLAIAAGYNYNLAVKPDGTVAGWGYGVFGQTTIPASATNVVAIAAGYYHSLALRADGTVVGWGYNGDGETTIPASAASVVAIAAGYLHSLALKADGTVVGWGDNGYGQITISASATNGVAIAASGWHSLALRADGTVVGWGRNDYGQTTIPADTTNVVAIAAGAYHSLVLKADGTVVGWGDNDYGQTTIPADATNVVAIAAGNLHSLALKADGTVVSWGWNGYGQTTIPASATHVAAIAAGSYHSLAFKADGTVVGWGDNGYGQSTSPASLNNLNLPIAVTGTVDVDSPGIYVLTYSTTNALGAVAITTRTVIVGSLQVSTLPASNLLNDTAMLNGTVNPMGSDATAWFEWGASVASGNLTLPGSVGSGTQVMAVKATVTGLTRGVTYHYRCVASNIVGVVRGADQVFWLPALILNGPSLLTNECHVPFVDPGGIVSGPLLAIAAGGYHSLALKADGTVVGWGLNNQGQTNCPASATNVVAIAAGHYHNLALKADGTVVGWGSNNRGQITIPASAFNVVAIAAGQYHNLAVRAGGSVVGWGYNVTDQIIIPAGATHVVAIAAGAYHSLAVRADGSVVGWGANDYGQATSPASATNVVTIAASGGHNLALRADGTVVGWGDNNYGQITIPSSATNVVAIAAGYTYSLAVRADGTLVGWGANNYGQITIPSSATNVVAIAAGNGHSLALKADGTVVGWGLNNQGQTNCPAGVYQLNLPIAVTGTVAVDNPGTYVLTYRTTNALGTVTTTTRTVMVADTLTPVLVLPGANFLMHELGTPFVEPGATATDLCAGDLTASIVSNITVNPSVPGTYTNTYAVTDASGNLAQTNRIVVVVTSPVVTQMEKLGNGSFHFTFTNTPGARFRVLASTNVALPSNEWIALGSVTEDPPGVFQFTDDHATNHPVCFYRLMWP